MKFGSKHKLVLAIIGVILLSLPQAEATGKKRKKAAPAPVAASSGKRVLALAPVERVRIEMPDNQIRDFGDDFLAKLHTRFTQGNQFVVMDPEPIQKERFALRSITPSDGYEWESSPVPAATVRISVDALSFVTGARGGRMFYGFDERLRNSFNDGSGARMNEFPVNTESTGARQPSWFDGTFTAVGSKPFDSHSGLDLGDGFGLDVLFAWLRVKYAKYNAELRLQVQIDAPLAGRNETRSIHVSGKGYFYDVAGGYAAWDGAIRLARRDAMLKAFNRAFEQASAHIQASVGPLPLTARVDAIAEDGRVFIATGRSARIPVGTTYLAVENPAVRLQVAESFNAGSAASLVSGEPTQLYPGMLLREFSAEFAAPPAPRLSRMALSAENPEVAPRQIDGIIVDLPIENLPPPQFGGSVREISRTRAFFLSLLEMVFLPYRIWRYHQYDRSYKAHADDSSDSVGAPSLHRSAREWAESARKEAWARQIGLDKLAIASDRRAVVAVIDSGMDYNHSVLHESLWLNPNATRDVSGRVDRYGWDFISGDSRPFDDGYHGTRVASALVAVAPSVQLMPLKVFNPWGITSSAALLAAFEYAVKNGAEIILCPWSTRFHSEAIERGIALAAEHGIPVIAAAGDLGRDLRIAPAYPAALAPKYPNLIVVTAVDANDRPLRLSNAHPRHVHIAAPGAEIRVADPRNMETRASSTGIAAAIVAGTLARNMADLQSGEASGIDWRRELQMSADEIPSLKAYAQNGYRLKIAK